ncbi:MAG: hypothetical protein GX567_10710 [Clostridia bacterium]|nr:hypothetical protein [Clostridia bacterium]
MIGSSVKYWILKYEHVFLSSIMAMLIIIIFFGINIQYDQIEGACSLFPFTFFIIALFVVFCSQTSLIQFFLPVTVSLGCTRKHYFIGQLIGQIVYGLQIIVLTILLFCLMTHLKQGELVRIAGCAVLVCLAALTFCTIFNTLFLAFKKYGMIFLVISLLSIGAISSIVMVMVLDAQSQAGQIVWILRISSYVQMGWILAAAGCYALASYCYYRVIKSYVVSI